MIEITLRDYLKKTLPDTEVYTEREKSMPESFLLLEKTGETESDFIYQATVSIKAVSKKSMYNAMALSRQVIHAMRSSTTLSDVSGVRQVGEMNYTDTERKEYCYQSAFQVYYMEV